MTVTQQVQDYFGRIQRELAELYRQSGFSEAVQEVVRSNDSAFNEAMIFANTIDEMGVSPDGFMQSYLENRLSILTQRAEENWHLAQRQKNANLKKKAENTVIDVTGLMYDTIETRLTS